MNTTTLANSEFEQKLRWLKSELANIEIDDTNLYIYLMGGNIILDRTN